MIILSQELGMKREEIKIGGIPSILWGDKSNRLYLYVHGQGGCKEEAQSFAEAAGRYGWQVLSFDLPGHGERKGDIPSFNPWHAVPELKQVMDWSKSSHDHIALFANSIGAWFSLLSYAGEPFCQCLFVSPILDMHRLIHNMMQWAGVTEERLEKEKTIPTDFGQTLSWEYLTYVRAHPVDTWPAPTRILYADQDHLTDRQTVDSFVSRFGCDLTVMEGGEHWFHTPEQLNILNTWMIQSLNQLDGSRS